MECLWKLLSCEKQCGLVAVPNCEYSSSSSKPVECMSYKIRHTYPQRLVTYDAEELGERRLIRHSDLRESELKMMNVKCETNTGSGNSPKQKLAKSLDILELSKMLYSSTTKRKSGGADKSSTWESLLPIQKFSYYWLAETGNQLRPTPYKNFKEHFNKQYLKMYPGTSKRELRKLMRFHWRCLASEERVPFNLHALLFHVSTGAVNPNDDCAVRVLLNRWR